MRSVHAVVPAVIDDPLRPSGGNVYDRHVCHELAAAGWSVHEHPVAGPWPQPDPTARGDLAGTLESIPEHSLVLIDGLLASPVPEVVQSHAGRLRIVVLLHMPLGISIPGARSAERVVTSTVAAILTTSQWTRQWLLDHYDLLPCRVRVAEPGVEPKARAAGTSEGNRLLCVGAVQPHKGQDVLVAALSELSDLSWSCQVVGALDVAPGFAEDVRRDTERRAIAGRVHFPGPLTGADLDAAYTSADVLLVASRAETYGMAVTEALAHGLPVIATSAGGLPEALSRTADGRRPGLLVRPDDASALAAAVRAFLTDRSLRRRLRQAAADRRSDLPLWSHTTVRVAHVLAEVGRSASEEPDRLGSPAPLPPPGEGAR